MKKMQKETYTYAVRPEANAVAAYDSRGELVGEALARQGEEGQILMVHDGSKVIGQWERTGDRDLWRYAGVGRKPTLPEWATECLIGVFDLTQIGLFGSWVG